MIEDLRAVVQDNIMGLKDNRQTAFQCQINERYVSQETDIGFHVLKKLFYPKIAADFFKFSKNSNFRIGDDIKIKLKTKSFLNDSPIVYLLIVALD